MSAVVVVVVVGGFQLSHAATHTHMPGERQIGTIICEGEKKGGDSDGPRDA